MSLDYIRKTYGIDVKRGDRVTYRHPMHDREGTVTGATHYLKVRFDGWKFSERVHPTDERLTIHVDQRRKAGEK